MKILYIGTPTSSDYMSDALFHGLRSVLGTNVVDGIKIGYMYNDYPTHDLQRHHGKGFSLASRLADDGIDRTDLVSKIKSKYFDYVIYGASFRHYALDFLELVLSVYPQNKIVFVNGSDSERGTVQPTLINLPGIHFLRERLSNDQTHPISFAVPKEIIVNAIPEKEYYLMPLVPGVKSTYIYSDEATYYKAYQSSLFGLTWKKAGWDCLRHYEILSQGCLPLFIDIHHLPESLMKTFPKEQVSKLLDVAVRIEGYKKDMKFYYGEEHSPVDMAITNVNFSTMEFTDPDSYGYYEIANDLLEYTKKHLTTEYLAEYVISVLKTYHQ